MFCSMSIVVITQKRQMELDVYIYGVDMYGKLTVNQPLGDFDLHYYVIPHHNPCHNWSQFSSTWRSRGGTTVLCSLHIVLWICCGETVNYPWRWTALQCTSQTLEQSAHLRGWWPPETERVNTAWLLGACKKHKETEKSGAWRLLPP